MFILTATQSCELPVNFLSLSLQQQAINLPVVVFSEVI